MKLYLVRHAQPLVAAGLCYGQLDVEADLASTEQAAQALQPLLADALVGAVRSSPLRRAQMLARRLADHLALPVQQDARLSEMHFGQWEGVAWSDVPKAAVDDWTTDFAHHCFGGGESTQQVLERVWAALQEAREVGADQLWVTHAGVIRAARYLLTRGEPRIESAAQWPREAPVFGGWDVLEL